jgi:hypothetical protein
MSDGPKIRGKRREPRRIATGQTLYVDGGITASQ